MEMGDQRPQLYTVLNERKTDRMGHAMMGSAHTYEIRPSGVAASGGLAGQTAAAGGILLPATGAKRPVELTLDPSELEMDPGSMAAR